MKNYNREVAVNYAFKYGMNPNKDYPYYEGNDCTNFVSQCFQAGGCKNHFHSTHPWWCVNYETSICWSVASSLYWYIRVCTKENEFGIKAITKTISGDSKYTKEISDLIQLGDIIQYVNYEDRIQHSTIITDFKFVNGIKQPLVSQHTFQAINITWRKNFKRTIFHHIYDINELD